ncbi:Glutathione-binding protein GsiB precursor [Clavibacter michiganensis]|uniref:Glutathione-binding protein GsiB n=1 Tax=Clavibacter michiganensis TaxID=28447 RepID=A0A251XSI8_9MICO|nr:Glutathione-binding protein GsiB precursor [Clavibacter michiganensis]
MPASRPRSSRPARPRGSARSASPARPARSAALAALALASTLALSGCFAASPGTTAASADRDGRIRLAMLQPPRSGLTPLSDDAFKLARWSTAETLVTLDDLGDAQPLLATGWTRTDDLTWSFDVRPDVPFHDGTTLTAAQAAASLTTAATASPKPRILDGVDLTATADGDRVVVRTATPDPLVPQRLSSPQLAILAASAYAADGTVSPVGTGTGPFRLTAVDGTSSATLDRFDGYWGGRAAAAGIDVRFVPDGTARAAALRTGTADVVEAIPVGQAAQVDPELLHEVAMPRTNTLYLNTRTGPFADPAVRAAAQAAVDRAALVQGVYEGRADAAEGLLGPALPWAADLRDDASYRDAVATRATPAQVDGVPITLGTFTDRAELPEVAVQLEQQLEAAGFQVTQDVREYQYIEADALAGRFDAFILSRATVLDSGDPAAYLFSDFACAGSFNISQECDPAVDEALATASALPAGPDRRAAIMRVEALVLADDAAVPLLHERVIQGEAAGVSGAVRDPRERALITVDTRVDG